MPLLFKYSYPDNPPPLSAVIDYLVNLQKGKNNPTLHPCIFFAIDGKMNTYTAHDYLAITYYPRSCYQYNLPATKVKLEDNKGNDLTDVYYNDQLVNVPRCWPSFGQQGGAREVILVDDSKSVRLTPSSKVSSFQDGGETDEFHQDNSANYDIVTAVLIANIIVSALQIDEVTLRDVENDNRGSTIGSLRSHSGLTINGKLRNGKFISISSGFIVYGSSMRIKLWVSLWMDDEGTKRRHIYGPLERELTFSLFNCNFPITDGYQDVKEFFAWCIQNQYYPYCELNDVIRDLINKATKVTEGFFNSMSRRYQLP